MPNPLVPLSPCGGAGAELLPTAVLDVHDASVVVKEERS